MFHESLEEPGDLLLPQAHLKTIFINSQNSVCHKILKIDKYQSSRRKFSRHYFKLYDVTQMTQACPQGMCSD